jgi:hypothetical protein
MAYKKNDLIYLAGIMDGEGWFSIQRDQITNHARAKSATYTPNIGVANTDFVLIQWLIERFGGNYSTRFPTEGQYGTKIRYEWHPSKVTFIEKVIPKIIPFLVIKKRRAEILLETRSLTSINYRRLGVPKEISKKREILYLELRKLNNTKHKVIPVQPQRLSERTSERMKR